MIWTCPKCNADFIDRSYTGETCPNCRYLYEFPGHDRETVPAGSHGWIQWKGTAVCMDLHCVKCGGHSHIDADFAYYIRCPHCGAVYCANPHVEMIELSEDEVERVKKHATIIVDAEE